MSIFDYTKLKTFFIPPVFPWHLLFPHAQAVRYVPSWICFLLLHALPNQMPQTTIQLLVISVYEHSPCVLGVLSGVVREFGQCEADFFLFVLSPLIYHYKFVSCFLKNTRSWNSSQSCVQLMTSRTPESLKISPAASPPKQISEKEKYLMFLQKKKKNPMQVICSLGWQLLEEKFW